MKPSDTTYSVSWFSKMLIKVKQIFFSSSRDYWETRYELGDGSGKGSYGKLARFKAEVINDFVIQQEVTSVIEYGCGDGNQLSLATYPEYMGLDVSSKAVSCCKERFQDDKSKNFFLYDKTLLDSQPDRFKAELALSLDVIYHLVEDQIFHAYMNDLFRSAKKYVIIYSTDRDEVGGFNEKHVRHRKVSKYVEKHFPRWELIRHINNPYPGSDVGVRGDLPEFFVFRLAHP